ncbi:hypothetical protein TNCV_2578951 [Trichonephila clavipes]|nr:hypothetical protein TNCV_2578951 [Trichonephila clavipes]
MHIKSFEVHSPYIDAVWRAAVRVKSVMAQNPPVGGEQQFDEEMLAHVSTATAGSDVVQSGRPIFDDFFQHLWPYIGNNTANVVFQIVKHLWLIRIDQ